MMTLYLETTVFNRVLEPEREYYDETKVLFAKIANGEMKAYSSEYVIKELEAAPEPKRSAMLELISKYNITVLKTDMQAENLADIYINAEIIPKSHRMDGIHIAITAINKIDCIISFNFKHINKLKTKIATEAIHVAKEFYSP
jgi:hypothetical protein